MSRWLHRNDGNAHREIQLAFVWFKYEHTFHINPLLLEAQLMMTWWEHIYLKILCTETQAVNTEMLPAEKLVSRSRLLMFELIRARASSKVSPSTSTSAVPSKGHRKSCRADIKKTINHQFSILLRENIVKLRYLLLAASAQTYPGSVATSLGVNRCLTLTWNCSPSFGSFG